ADITSLGELDEAVVRNGNVMYEVGLANAVRLPEEVLLFRSDQDRLLFDVQGIRVTRYDPDNDPAGATTQVAQALVNALMEVKEVRHRSVQRMVSSLDADAFLLLQAASDGIVKHPAASSIAQALDAIGVRTAIGR